jgi:hypothetical protein
MTTFNDRFGVITVYPSELGYQSYALTTSTALTWPSLGDTSSNLAAAFIRAASTVTGAGFILPDAREVSVGRVGRIRNVGSIAIPVFSTSGSTVATISAGQDYLYTLIDNTTSGGIWDTEQLGVGTASADANFLAGNGLTVSGSKLVASWPVVYTGSSGYVLTYSSNANIITWTGGTGSLDLTSLPGIAHNGYIVGIKNAGTGTLTIAGDLITAKIDGAETLDLGPNDSTFLVGDGGFNYRTVGLNTTFGVGVIAIDVTNSSNYTINAAQYNNSIFIITGTLNASALTLNFPAAAGAFTVINQTNRDGVPRTDMTMTLQTTAAALAVNLPFGASRAIANDGTNLYFSDDQTTLRPARNILYYADFSRNPWIRGTTFTSTTSTQYTADRVTFKSNSGSAWTVTRAASAFSGCQYDLRVQNISGSPPASGLAYIGFDLELSEAITLRNKNVTLAVQAAFGDSNIFFDGQVYTNTNANQRILDSLANGSGWEYLMSFGGPIPGATSTSRYYLFQVNPGADGSGGYGATVTSTISQLSVMLQIAKSTTAGPTSYMSINRVALVEGNFMTFDDVNATDIEAQCQRFAWAYTASAANQTIAAGQAVSGTQALIPIQFPTAMVKAPTVSVTASQFQVTTSTGAAATATTTGITLANVTRNVGELTVNTVTSLLTAGNATRLQTNTSVASILFSADL